GPVAAVAAQEARDLRLRPHLRAVAAPPRGGRRPLVRPVVPDQPVGLVRALVCIMMNGHARGRNGSNGVRTVLYIMDTLGLSGRTKGYIDLALHLDPARYRAVFCSLGEESSELVERLRERAISIEVLPLAAGLRPDGV